jgi:hypothetical protein
VIVDCEKSSVATAAHQLTAFDLDNRSSIHSGGYISRTYKRTRVLLRPRTAHFPVFLSLAFTQMEAKLTVLFTVLILYTDIS